MSSDKTPTKTASATPVVKGVYDYMPGDADIPADLIVNAAGYGIIIGAPARLPEDNPRLDPGDRRQGKYYASLVGNLQGLQFLKNLSKERARELEKKRKQRTGEMEQDWVMEARARAEAGGGPPSLQSDRRAVLSELQKAAGHLGTGRPE